MQTAAEDMTDLIQEALVAHHKKHKLTLEVGQQILHAMCMTTGAIFAGLHEKGKFNADGVARELEQTLKTYANRN